MESSLLKDKAYLPAISVADHISAMLAYWDNNLVCRFANAAYSHWFGKSREDMVHKMTIKELLGPALYQKNEPYIVAALSGQPQTFEREITLPNGTVRHSIANYFPDVHDGVVKGFFAHVADITPVKLLEKDLVESSAIINSQNKRLLNFANIISHNFKSYSANLEAIINMMITASSQEEKDQLLLYLQKISKNFGKTVVHVNEIVRSHNLSSLQYKAINLHEYINTVVDVLRVEIEGAKAVIINDVPEAIILHANPAYMESILLNFLTNAIKYKHPDRNPSIHLTATICPHEVVLHIKDNGLGIDLQKHGKNLFGLYNTFHKNPHSEGVGLFLTRSQVEAMGGRIEVESEEGAGTAFSIYFKL